MFFGLVSAYIETISASDAAVAKDPNVQIMKPYTKVTGPPFIKAVEFALILCSIDINLSGMGAIQEYRLPSTHHSCSEACREYQFLRFIKQKIYLIPTIDMKPKFLCYHVR
jgi:hypothetical protein